MYKIILHKRVLKFINNRTYKEKQNIKQKLEILQKNPYPTNYNIDLKKLKNKNGFRLRIGKFRFIYDVVDEELIIYMEKADSRGDIY